MPHMRGMTFWLIDILVVAAMIAILVWLIFDQVRISRETFLEERLPPRPILSSIIVGFARRTTGP